MSEESHFIENDPAQLYRALLQPSAMWQTYVDHHDPRNITYAMTLCEETFRQNSEDSSTISGFDKFPEIISWLRGIFHQLSEHTFLTFREVPCDQLPDIQFTFNHDRLFFGFFKLTDGKWMLQTINGITKFRSVELPIPVNNGTDNTDVIVKRLIRVIELPAPSAYFNSMGSLKTLVHELLHGLFLKHPRYYHGDSSPPYLPDYSFYEHDGMTVLSYNRLARNLVPMAYDAWQLWNYCFHLREPMSPIQQFITLPDLTAIQRHPLYGGRKLPLLPESREIIDTRGSNPVIYPNAARNNTLWFRQENPLSSLHLDLGRPFQASYFGEREFLMPEPFECSSIELPEGAVNLVLPSNFDNLLLRRPFSRSPMTIYFHAVNTTQLNRMTVKNPGTNTRFVFPPGANISSETFSYDSSCSSSGVSLHYGNTTAFLCGSSLSESLQETQRDEAIPFVANIWQLLSFYNRVSFLDYGRTYNRVVGVINLCLCVSYILGAYSQYPRCQEWKRKIKDFFTSDSGTNNKSSEYKVIKMVGHIALSQAVPFRFFAAFKLGSFHFSPSSETTVNWRMVIYLICFLADCFFDAGVLLLFAISVFNILIHSITRCYQSASTPQANFNRWQGAEILLTEVAKMAPGGDLILKSLDRQKRMEDKEEILKEPTLKSIVVSI
jgi:hypothetical protein